jgi:hypothetical protein
VKTLHHSYPRRFESALPSFLKTRWIAALVFALVLIIAAFSLQPFARSQTRKLLDRLKGVKADFRDVHVSIFPLRYRITHLKIREEKPKTKEPAFYADEIAVTLRWSRLLTGHLAGTVAGQNAKVVLHQPPEGSQMRLPPIEEVVPFPAVLEQARVDGSEVLYVWVREKNQPSMWFHDIVATLENVGSRPDLVKGPMVLSAKGKLQRSGTMTVYVTADPYATPLSFAGKANVSHFDPAEMNGLIASTKGVKLTPGRFDMQMSFECRKGRLRGWVEPRLSGTEVTSDGDVGSALKAFFGNISMSVASPADGTDASGRIAFEDNLTDPKRQLWPTLEKVVENALLIALQESIKRNVSPGEKRGEASSNKEPTKLEIKR